jgi:aspartyl-tRNA(Asn)/glutamyl-tRNA(Gln) amidotransferase subunit A
MKNIPFATIKELREMLDKKEISASELLDIFIKRFEQYDQGLGAALEIFDKKSIVESAAQKGCLSGIPGIIKDVIAQNGRALTCASKILQGLTSTFDATAVSRIKGAGGLLLGRANCDEFAMGSSSETSAYKKVHNPWDLSRVSGGSSGGSIAAVAAGLVPWALGTETGGSVRQPAAFCGIVGSKPTYGLVSRYGLVAYASSFDQIGVATRTVYDNALVMSVIAGQDQHDSSSLAVRAQDYTSNLDGSIKKDLVIGVIDDALHAEGVDPEIVAAIEEAIKELESLGAKIKRVSLPVLEYGISAYVILSRAEAASNLAKFDGVRYGYRDMQAETLEAMYSRTRAKGFGDEVRRRILIGNYVLSAGHAAAFYKNAKKVQALISKGFADLFKDVQLLVMPVTPTPAFKIGGITNPLQMDLQDYFTCPINVAGIPAVSVPCGFTKENLPIGFQFVGPQLSESLIFQTAHAYEQATQWHTMHPKGY